MSRAATQRDGVFKGVITCDGSRCRKEHVFDVAAPYEPSTFLQMFGAHRLTEQEAARQIADRAAFWKELETHRPPAGWVHVDLYDSSPISLVKEFHSPHCAALWLNRWGSA